MWPAFLLFWPTSAILHFYYFRSIDCGFFQVKLVFNFDVEAYYATAQITTEVAICLAMARDQLPYAGKGGVLSPSVACGQMLVDRLLANGMSVSVE